MMSSISFRDRHKVATALEPFEKLQLLDGLWHGYVRDFDPALGDVPATRVVANELDEVLTLCVQSARDLTALVENYRSEVTGAAQTLLSAQDLTPEAEVLWRKALEKYGDGASLATHVFSELEQKLPRKREELREQRRRLERGQSGQADMTMGESCAMLIGIAIMGVAFTAWPVGLASGITAGIVCGKIDYFNGPTNGGEFEP
jgi:hypothetical protein